jgi:2OG-Fe(II) oxygenase superfamily
MFKYYKKNIDRLLPSLWDKDVIDFASKNEEKVILVSNSVTSRELTKNETIDDLYRGYFYEVAQEFTNEKLFVAQNPLYAINLNIQKGKDMRYECHVDSNPLQGLLYVTTHKEGDGGELVVSNNENSIGVNGILEDCQKIFPTKGDLVFFDARKNPHYVEPLKSDEGIRIAITMNFYTLISPEENRPKDLNEHLFKLK